MVGVDAAVWVEVDCTQLFGDHLVVPQVLLLGGLLRARHLGVIADALGIGIGVGLILRSIDGKLLPEVDPRSGARASAWKVSPVPK
jgi:hypothetical protein